jgi:hypothetical protein
MPEAQLTRSTWNRQRPRALVVACSDGRLQENLDDFLHHHLGITHYDRLYAPGGGGVLASSGSDYLRADAFRREFRFLLGAHAIEDVFLIFHGPAEDGPDEALCADYRRKLPWAPVADIRRQQEQDAVEATRLLWGVRVAVHAFRCEVCAGDRVQFVPLASTEGVLPRRVSGKGRAGR